MLKGAELARGGPHLHMPQSRPSARASSIVRRVGAISTLLTLTVGITVIIGWIIRVPILTSLFPGFVTMKFNTATGFVFCGIAIALLARSTSASHWKNMAAAACGVVVCTIGTAILLQYAGGVDLHVDQLLWNQSNDPATPIYPGRMSPVTASVFLFLGVSIVALSAHRRERLAICLITIALVFGMTAVVGYLYGASALYAAGHFTSVALNTSIAFIATSIGLLCLRPDRGLLRIMSLPNFSGEIARRLIPLAIIGPIVLGGVRLWAQRQGFVGTEVGLALYCLSNILVFVGLVYWNTNQLLRTEQSLHESMYRYRLLADSLPQMVWTSAPSGKLTYCNQAWCRYTGLTFEKTRLDGDAEVIHPDDLGRHRNQWQESVATGGDYECETRFKRAADNTYRWHLVRGIPMRNACGGIIEWVGTCTDVDDQKRAKEDLETKIAERTAELERAKADYEHILNNSVDVISVVDGDGRFVRVNPACQIVWGYKPEELIGRNYLDFVCPEDRDATAQCEMRAFTGDSISNFENRYICKDGRLVTMLWASEWDAGTNCHFSIARDITKRKEAEEKLLEAKELAESANRAKSEFLANMSHEIRTPMNGIIGMTELALETNLSDVQREYLENVKYSADSLLSLINDILDFSKIEAGKLALEKIPFDLRGALEKTLKALRVRAGKKVLTLKDDVDLAVPSMVIGDSMRLCQIIVNLIDNAIKFTERGEISLSVKVADPSDEDVITLDFVVHDTGIGISPVKQNRIFSAFEQADGSTTRNYGGTGLGLAICSRLVGQMGGNLTVESELNVGSTFRFTAKFARCRELRVAFKSESVLSPNEAPMRILVADDNAINQSVAAGILRGRGHHIRTASDGREAVAIYQREKLDLILMDVQMPEVDGHCATRQIRQMELATGGHVPIIAMTAHAMAGDKQRCLDAGMDDYISKPVNKTELLDAIARFGGERLREEDVDLAVKHQLLARFDGDAALLHRVSRLFLEQSPEMLQRMKDAAVKKNAGELRETVHKFIGSLGAIGAETALGYVKQLERLAELKAFDRTQSIINCLENELDSFQSRLERIG